ncbi:hypothetical protein ACFO1B_11700 [Dactylosporangium siamense]|uniref:DUF3352 domain-containing protein n=1 Tax=Dactylosporangium siamense TaxID=685454 RepID=A0A919PJP0_9ACTN|nr:hypothetical protein [Dactylosporangium siamense]GIG44466.1 hypothetical protein Dsi01nite_025070 [Dactylosporangium siamense]
MSEHIEPPDGSSTAEPAPEAAAPPAGADQPDDPAPLLNPAPTGDPALAEPPTSPQGPAPASGYGDLGAFLAGVTPVDADVIESPPPRRRRPVVLALTSAAVVLVVLLGGGAFALARLWNGPVGTLPEELVPGSVAAFARLDLSPGIGQRLKVEALLRKAAGSGGAPKSFDDAKRDVFADAGAPIGYDDVASWFDDRVGVAVWGGPEGSAGPVVLLVLSSRDDGKARTALAAAQQKVGTNRLGFVAGDGRALLAFGGKDLQRLATSAADAAKKAPLSKSPAFTSAVAKLPADQPGLAWADLARVTELQRAFLDAAIDEEGFDDEEAFDIAPVLPPTVTGMLVAGVQAGDDGFEVRARVSGGGLPLTGATGGTDALALLGALPAGVTAAGVASGPFGNDSLFGDTGGLLSTFLFPMSMFGFAVGEASDPEEMPPGFDPDTGLPPGVDPSDPAAVEKYFREHPELLTGGAMGMQKSTEALTKAISTATSVSFTVAGLPGTAAQAPTSDGSDLGLQLDLRLADAAAAKQLQTDLAELVKAGGTVCEVRGEHVVLRTKAYKGGTGKLADDPRFRAATAGGVPNATTALYFGSEPGSTPATSVGVTVGRDGADTVVMAKILVG